MSFLRFYCINSTFSQCDRHTQDKGEYLAEKYGERYVDTAWGGGRNISTDVNYCDYNTYSGKLELNIKISFRGLFFSSNYYVINGNLIINSSDKVEEFEITYMNDRAKSTRRKQIASAILGGVVIYNMDN